MSDFYCQICRISYSHLGTHQHQSLYGNEPDKCMGKTEEEVDDPVLWLHMLITAGAPDEVVQKAREKVGLPPKFKTVEEADKWLDANVSVSPRPEPQVPF